MMILRSRRYLRGAPQTPAAAWTIPPRSVLLMIGALVLGLAGLAWSERQVFERFYQRAAMQDIGGGTDRWTPIEGSVIWRLANGPAGPEIRASIDAPPAALTIDFTIRRNSDASLPASHVVAISARVPAAFPRHGIADIGPPAFKRNPDRADTTALAGTMVKLDRQTFLFGLSPVPADLAKNLAAMQQNFITLPLVFTSGRRAIVTFEKGTTGTAVFEAALAAWQSTTN